MARYGVRGLVAAAALAAAAGPAGAQCLTNPSDAVGNPVFGATVATFTSFGINPNVTCIENGLWKDPTGFLLGSYVKGAESSGFGYDPKTLGAYNGASLGSLAADANGRDFYWVQDTSPGGIFNGALGGAPSTGIVWDLGGQANQLAVFVFVDHGPVPQEVLENTAWLSNDPNALDAGWTQASLTHVYGAGWSPDPDVADGFVAVYQLAGGATFRYASVTWGGPGSIQRDGDNEIDAVGGLTVNGGGVGTVTPEPMTLSLVGLGLVGLGIVRRRRG
ncbi:MAG: PEP-CTERM sorting domain-containing protein [Gemmatirosa sp.]|nr:PEP-CTERM sorting domain-containing protein [Gemmatirosa sp.]